MSSPTLKRSAWPDKLVPALLVAGIALTVIDIVWTFTIAPLVQGAALSEPVVIAGQVITTKLLLSQKIFFLHVPVAVASMVLMFFTALYGVRFLMTKNRAYDLRARTVTQVALVFILATMVSGDLWTRFEWGVWWVWEPRLTTYFILMLLVIGYFVLRSAIDDPERRATFASVFGIIAFIDAPISFMVTRLIPSSIHPVVFRTDSGLPPTMLIPFLLGMFGMLMVAFAVYRIALNVHEAAQMVDDLKERLEEQDAARTAAAAEEARQRLMTAAERAVAADPDAGTQVSADADTGAQTLADAAAPVSADAAGEKDGAACSPADPAESPASPAAPSDTAAPANR